MNDNMELINEKDIKNLKMSIGYRKKDGIKINIKDYSTYKDFEKLFNKMPKSKSLIKGVQSTLFSIYSMGVTKQSGSFLPANYTTEDLKEYFEYIKNSFKEIQENKDFILLQTRYSNGKNKIAIVVYYDDSFSKEEATGLLLYEFT